MEKLQVHMLQWTLRGGNKWSKPFGSRILYAYLLINLSPRLQEQVDDLHVTLGGCHVQGRGPRLRVGNIPQAPWKKNVLMCVCVFKSRAEDPSFFFVCFWRKKSKNGLQAIKNLPIEFLLKNTNKKNRSRSDLSKENIHIKPSYLNYELFVIWC